MRWAAVEAVAHQRSDTPIRRHHHNVGDRRGTQIGRVAAARKLLILVYRGLRDGGSVAWRRRGENRTDAIPCQLGKCLCRRRDLVGAVLRQASPGPSRLGSCPQNVTRSLRASPSQLLIR